MMSNTDNTSVQILTGALFTKGGGGVVPFDKAQPQQKRIYIYTKEFVMTNHEKDYSDWIKPATEDDNKRYALAEKNYLIEQMARQCEIGEKLVSYWLKSNSKIPEATQFFDACKLMYDESVPAGFLYSAREHWDTKDWRGKKGQLPTPTQLAETAMRML